MVVTVHLHTILQRQTAQGLVRRLEVELPQGSTIATLLQRVQVELEQEHLLLVVNGKLVQPDHQLQPGDEVHLIPAMSGG